MATSSRSPKVSILVPSYNHAEFLPDAINSVLAQTLEDWELIILDDGSSDGSLSVAATFEDPRITVGVNPSNLGTYGTLAKAMSMSSGEFVAVLNSDDLWLPTKLQNQIAMLDADNNLQLCYGRGSVLHPDGSETDPHGDWPIGEVQELLPYLLEENRVLASSVVFRRSAAAFDARLRYSGDWEALLRPARHSPVGFTKDAVSNWRMHLKNSFVRSPKQTAEEMYLRRSILLAEDYWMTDRVPERGIKRGLGLCAVHLCALEVLAGQVASARKTALKAFRLYPSVITAKRLTQAYLPKAISRSRLAGGRLISIVELPYPPILFG